MLKWMESEKFSAGKLESKRKGTTEKFNWKLQYLKFIKFTVIG